MKKYIYAGLMSATLMFSACDNGFEELNINPNGATSVPAGLLLADLQRVPTNIMYSTFVGGDMGSCWSQQWAKVQYNDEARYIPRQSIIQTLWDYMYTDGLIDTKIMYNLAEADNNPALQGVALTISAYYYSVITDAWGDVPFSEALTAATAEANITPKYDSQEEIYPAILAMLDQANDFYATGEGSINGSFDLIYQGDASKWQKFNNSLKFRLLMRVSSQMDVSNQLQEIVNTRAIMTSNGDNAGVQYLGSDPNANPIFETIVNGNRAEFKVSDVLVDMLEFTSDPRLSVYAGVNDGGIYRGKPAGLRNLPSDDYNYTNVSPIGDMYVEATLPGYWMTYPQLQFLMAEAAKKGLISGGDAAAETYYTKGIWGSMWQNGVPDAATTAYLVRVPYNPNNALQQIATQEWLALFCQGFESWTEQRRTGFPALTPALEGNINEIPSRYAYPSTEQSLNPASYKAAVAAQGADVLTTKMWWNK
jgi:hypothetical protein